MPSHFSTGSRHGPDLGVQQWFDANFNITLIKDGVAFKLHHFSHHQFLGAGKTLVKLNVLSNGLKAPDQTSVHGFHPKSQFGPKGSGRQKYVLPFVKAFPGLGNTMLDSSSLGTIIGDRAS